MHCLMLPFGHPVSCRVIALLVGVSFGLAANAHALEVPVASRITAVTVQLDRATVRREATVEAGRGDHMLVFADLPVALDRRSLDLAGPGLTVGRPVFREIETTGPVNPTTARLAAELDTLERRRRVERDRMTVQHLVLDVLRQPNLQPAIGGGNQLAELDGLIGLVETRSSEALRRMRAAQDDIDGLDADIARLEREIARLGEDPMRRLEVTVPVRVNSAGPVEIRLGYEVQGASFTPAYEARLDTGTKRLRLAALAEVIQRTGEDWSDVELTLSTATTSWQTAAPLAEPWYIDIWVKQPSPAPVAARAGPEKALPSADFAAVAIDRSAFDATYRLPGKVSIAADGTAHRVTIETVAGAAGLVWKALPELDPTAYLTASLDHAGEAPLLPGPVFLYRDGASVGETHLAGLQPGEPLELGFGADPAVEIERRLLTDERSATGLIGTTRQHERLFATTITNRRAGPVTLELFDRLPVPRDTRITVERLTATTTPAITAPDDRPGVLVWELELPPGATETVTFGYRIRHPADLQVTGF
ncbi:MAG: mucoidy inhibitor MuiA family protein [Geminicoccaceae bacterium]